MRCLPTLLVEIGSVKGVIQADVAYTKEIEMLPFGMYKYKYIFNYNAMPQGYLLKE